ncbi:LysR family transcriptional regulator [Saccharospirillum salsuginis]|uniref:LysR family transcriptional regulator n=1 Tax=Saccharospirillum salsuginis TaxID=418750 RepID=UPI0016747C6D|nr:LysR family transcriptional regulator [Saccharospirillum salsuginis]
MSTIDFSHLRLLAVYTTVVETGSFAAAARKLHTSRSRVSEQVAQLEADLGVRLLQRSTRQLTVTHEGQRVYDQARALPSILQDVEAIATPREPSGRVAITLNHDIAHKFILPRLADFQRRYPRIQLDFVLNDERMDLVSEQIDLAIRIGLPRDDSVVARVLYEEAVTLFASPAFVDTHGLPDTLAELEAAPWTLLTQSHHGDVVRLRQGDQTVEIRPTVFTRCNSPLLLQHLVLRGYGIGPMLPGVMRAEIEAGQLIPVMPELSSDPLVVSLVYPSRKQLPERTRAVVDYLMAERLFQQPEGL